MTSVVTEDDKTTEDTQFNLGADFKDTVELEEVKVLKDEDVATVLYVHRSKLYHFIKEDNYGGEVRTNYWKERGLGDIKIMQEKESKKCRIIMRQEKTLKPVANFMLTEECTLTPNTSPKSWVFNCHDFSDGETNLVQCAIKFKTEEIANEFQDAFNKAKILHAAAPASSGEEKTTADEMAALDEQAAAYNEKQAKRRESLKAQSALADSDYDSNEEDVDEGDEARLNAKHNGHFTKPGDAADAVTDAMAKATLKE